MLDARFSYLLFLLVLCQAIEASAPRSPAPAEAFLGQIPEPILRYVNNAIEKGDAMTTCIDAVNTYQPSQTMLNGYMPVSSALLMSLRIKMIQKCRTWERHNYNRVITLISDTQPIIDRTNKFIAEHNLTLPEFHQKLDEFNTLVKFVNDVDKLVFEAQQTSDYAQIITLYDTAINRAKKFPSIHHSDLAEIYLLFIESIKAIDRQLALNVTQTALTDLSKIPDIDRNYITLITKELKQLEREVGITPEEKFRNLRTLLVKLSNLIVQLRIELQKFAH